MPTTCPTEKRGQARRERAANYGSRLRGRQVPPCLKSEDDTARATRCEPESQMGLRPGPLQVGERDRTTAPKIQGLPAHLNAVRQV